MNEPELDDFDWVREPPMMIALEISTALLVNAIFTGELAIEEI